MMLSSLISFLDSFKRECKVCVSFKSNFHQKEYIEGFTLMRDLVNRGEITFYAGSCPLNDLERHLDIEDLYTIEHYFKCRCGTFYYTGYCVRGRPILRSNEKPTKSLAKTISGHYGELFENR